MDNENSFEYEDVKFEEEASCENELVEEAEIVEQDVEIIDAELPALDEKELEKKEKLKKKRKKWKVWYIVLLCLAGFWTTVLIMAGGIALMDYLLTREEEVDIDEAFELSALTDKQIVSKVDYFISDTDKFFTHGFGYSQADYDYDVYDRDECYFEATNLSGIKTVSVSCAAQSKIVFTIDAQSTAAKEDIKIVITSESEILAEFNANSPIMYTVTTEDEEHIFVKVLADEADVSVTVTRKIVGLNENPDI